MAMVLSATALAAQNQPQPSPDAPTQVQAQPPTHGVHTVSVTFNYDFARTPACSDKVTKDCVRQFIVYDISAGVKTRARLFTIAVPDGARGMVQGITGTSPRLDFESGKHQLAVTAQEPSGAESRHYAATVWVVIP